MSSQYFLQASAFLFAPLIVSVAVLPPSINLNMKILYYSLVLDHRTDKFCYKKAKNDLLWISDGRVACFWLSLCSSYNKCNTRRQIWKHVLHNRSKYDFRMYFCLSMLHFERLVFEICFHTSIFSWCIELNIKIGLKTLKRFRN